MGRIFTIRNAQKLKGAVVALVTLALVFSSAFAMPVHAETKTAEGEHIKIVQSGDKAGKPLTFTVTGTNQELYFQTRDSIPSDVVAGTEAYIPIIAESSYTDSPKIDFRSSDYEGKSSYTYERTIWKAGDITETISLEKYTIVDMRTPAEIAAGNVPPKNIWVHSDDEYVRAIRYSLLGVVYYSSYPAKNAEKYVKAGDVIPKYTPKKKGWKFKGWYTESVGGKKITPGKTKANFGSGYSQYLNAQWNTKIPVTYNANGGKIDGKKKVVKKILFRAKYGKMPTPTRAGYHFLGWYIYSGNTLGFFKYSGEGRSYDPKGVTFKARWVKKGKGNSVTLKEWDRFLLNKQYGLTYADVKAIIGGPGEDAGYFFGYSYGPAYRWYGPDSYGHPGYNKVTISFWATGNKNWSYGQACTPFPWRN